jgi:hypothetical protein
MQQSLIMFRNKSNKMKVKLSILIIMICSAVIGSCYYDKEALLYGNASACTDATGVVSYSQKIVPMMQQLCYNCHSGGSPGGGILMGTYVADKAIALNGKLYGSINHSSGYSPMPAGAPKMSACQIAVVKKWIDDGMLNN